MIRKGQFPDLEKSKKWKKGKKKTSHLPSSKRNEGEVGGRSTGSRDRARTRAICRKRGSPSPRFLFVPPPPPSSSPRFQFPWTSAGIFAGELRRGLSASWLLGFEPPTFSRRWGEGRLGRGKKERRGLEGADRARLGRGRGREKRCAGY